MTEVTESDIADFLQRLTAEAEQVNTLAQAENIKIDLEDLSRLMRENPHTITEKTVALLGGMALGSPYRDKPGHETTRHTQDPRQDVCLYALRAMVPLMWAAPDQKQTILEEFEYILEQVTDWQVGRETLFALAAPCTVEDEPLDEFIVKALVRESRDNVYAPLRATARDLLLLVSAEHEEVVFDALAAQKRGLLDTNEFCRARAINMLANRALSVSSSENEARSLMDIFNQIASDYDEEPEVREQAAMASRETRMRLQQGVTQPPFP